jgi:transcriptional regulator with XRE-family HTH domain
MTRLIQIREELGFTQQLMAMYLKINLSTLKMAETGLRELPTYALIKVAELEIKLVGQKEEKLYKDMHPAENACVHGFTCAYQLIKIKEKRYQLDLVLLEPKLEAMVVNYHATRTRLRLIEKVLQENEGSEFDAGAWQDQLKTAVNVLYKCATPVQVMLKCRIAMLHAQIELCKKAKLQIRKELPDLFDDEDDYEI